MMILDVTNDPRPISRTINLKKKTFLNYGQSHGEVKYGHWPQKAKPWKFDVGRQLCTMQEM